MSTIATKTVCINRTVKEVYEFATNMKNFKQWFPGVLEIESDSSKGHGVVGKQYLETVKTPFSGKRKISLKVVHAEKNEIFITEGDFSPLLPKMTMKFSEDTANSTILTWSMQSRNENFIFKALFLPIFKKVIQKRAETGVQNLKMIMEERS